MTSKRSVRKSETDLAGVHLSRFGVSVSVTYRLRFSSDDPTLTFKNGGIEIAGRVEAETDTFWAPNGFVSFKQLVTLDPGPGQPE